MRSERTMRQQQQKKVFYKKWWFWLISLIVLLVLIISIVFLINSKTTADYSTVEAETALNDGKDLKGKTVNVKVNKIAPNSAFGYNIMAGKHLNFVSPDNPDVKKGDSIIVKVTDVKSLLGSYIISYKK